MIQIIAASNRQYSYIGDAVHVTIKIHLNNNKQRHHKIPKKSKTNSEAYK